MVTLANHMEWLLLKYAVQRQITCPVSGEILDVRRAVLIVVRKGEVARDLVLDGAVWDERAEAIMASAAKHGADIEVIDGRELRRARR